MDATPEPRPAQKPAPTPRLRIDEIALSIRRSTPNGVRMEIRPPRAVTAADPHFLPLFEGWIPAADLCLCASGVVSEAFTAVLESAGAALGAPAAATVSPGEKGMLDFTLELSVP